MSLSFKPLANLQQLIRPLLLSLLASLLVSIPTQVSLAPAANANLLGTVYEAPNMAFGGGNGPYPANCTTGAIRTL